MTHGRLGSMDEQRNELLLLRGLDREDVDQGKKLVVFRDRGHGQLSGGNGWWTSGGSEWLGLGGDGVWGVGTLPPFPAGQAFKRNPPPRTPARPRRFPY